MSASRGPYRFVNREYFIVAYETDYDKLKRVVPEPLEPVSNVVLCTCLPFLLQLIVLQCHNSNTHFQIDEWINMPDSSGFGRCVNWFLLSYLLCQYI